MLDLLVHQTVPVLSQSQVIDSAFILNLVRDDSTHDAFLGLVADSLIQTRLHPSGLEQVTGEDPFTVLNAFASRLRSGFHFSAWPELADPAARESVYAVVRGVSAEPLGGDLGEQVDALRVLDTAFRRSAASERAQPISGDRGLGSRVLADLRSRDDGELQHVGRAVEEMRGEAGTDDKGRSTLDLDLRSVWRQILPDLVDGLGMGQEVVSEVSGVVDMHYNCVVAQSLGAATCVDETAAPQVPIGLRETSVPIEFDGRISFLLEREPAAQVLTWQAVKDRLMKRQFDSPGVRLQGLFEDGLVESVEGRRLIKVLTATPRRLLRAARVGMVGGATGFVVGDHLGGGLMGAVLGGLLTESVTPDQFLLGGRAADRWEEMVRRRAVGRLRRSVEMTMKTGKT